MPSALAAYGWDHRVAALFADLDVPGATRGRVVRVDRGSCMVVTEHGLIRTSPYGTTSRLAGLSAVPATGDWVAVERRGGDEPGVVAVVPRWSAISRKDPHDRVAAEQVLAANVDVAAVVCALDRPIGKNRIERMLAAAREGGASPVVVLTKADLAADGQQARREAASAAGGADVHVTSTVSGEGIEGLRALLSPARTLALLGPSGAGKSSLVNRLVGEEVQSTGAVRAADARGRHTTTARQLVPVPGGGVLLDTPGLRSLPLWDAASGTAATFDDVEGLAPDCRFRDCRHDTEPGCAVLAAVAGGTLDARRLDSYRTLRDELDTLDARRHERARRSGGRRATTAPGEGGHPRGPRPR